MQMHISEYPRLNTIWLSTRENKLDLIENYLIDVWIDSYSQLMKNRPTDIVEVRDGNFLYLFDIISERLIAAWGITSGRNSKKRPKSRMRGHPLSAGNGYHRGHAISHVMGGGTDINLLPQRAKINVGPFKALENKAANSPGSLYFTYWMYSDHESQVPTKVQQGLAIPSQPLVLRSFTN